MGSKTTSIKQPNGGEDIRFLLSFAFFHVCTLQAYALNEMANIERIRNVEQQITSTVDQMTNDFKERMQTILSDNQLLLSRKTFSF